MVVRADGHVSRKNPVPEREPLHSISSRPRVQPGMEVFGAGVLLVRRWYLQSSSPRPSRQFQQGRGANVTCKTQHDPGPGQGPQLANSDDWSEKRCDWLTARPLPPAIGPCVGKGGSRQALEEPFGPSGLWAAPPPCCGFPNGIVRWQESLGGVPIAGARSSASCLSREVPREECALPPAQSAAAMTCSGLTVRPLHSPPLPSAPPLEGGGGGAHRATQATHRPPTGAHSPPNGRPQARDRSPGSCELWFATCGLLRRRGGDDDDGCRPEETRNGKV